MQKEYNERIVHNQSDRGVERNDEFADITMNRSNALHEEHLTKQKRKIDEKSES